MLRAEPNLICLSEGNGGKKAGFCTTNQRKLEYYSLLEIAMAEGCLQFVENLVCHDPVACMIELKNQIMAFKRIAPNQQSAFSERKVTFSGKVDGTGAMAGHRLCDDLVLSLQMALYISTLVYRRNSLSFPYSTFKTL